MHLGGGCWRSVDSCLRSHSLSSAAKVEVSGEEICRFWVGRTPMSRNWAGPHFLCGVVSVFLPVSRNTAANERKKDGVRVNRPAGIYESEQEGALSIPAHLAFKVGDKGDVCIPRKGCWRSMLVGSRECVKAHVTLPIYAVSATSYNITPRYFRQVGYA